MSGPVDEPSAANDTLLVENERLRRELEQAQQQNLVFAADLARTYSTERHSTRALSRTREQLARSAKLATLGQMVAAMAHDVGNMISPIGGYADLLLMCPDLPEKGQKYTKKIVEAAGRANVILRSLMDFGSNRGGSRTAVRPEEVVRASVTLLEYGLVRKGVKIATELEPGLPAILANAGQIEQVLVNLFVNAQHAMEHKGGGELRIGAKRIAVTTIDNGPDASSNDRNRVVCVCITVSDDGDGIPPHVMDHIFEPFFTTKEKGKGTGLGLFICHDIVEQHGGTLDVTSTIGSGTTFSMTLPACATPPNPEESAHQ